MAQVVAVAWMVWVGSPHAEAQTYGREVGYAPHATVYVPPISLDPPTRRHRELRPDLGFSISGAVLIAAPALLNAVGGFFAGMQSFGEFDGTWDAFRYTSLIPIGGPWVQLALLPDLLPEGVDGGAWSPWLITNGVLQLAGLGLLITGIVFALERTPTPALAVLPSVGPEGGGLTLGGVF